MSKFGLIEGFYGKSYDFTSRHELISSMAGTDLNFYLYAPKEDPFLRNNFDLTPNESWQAKFTEFISCLLYTSPSPRDKRLSRMPSSA